MGDPIVIINHLKGAETILTDVDRILRIGPLAFSAYKPCGISHGNNLLRCCNALIELK